MSLTPAFTSAAEPDAAPPPEPQQRKVYEVEEYGFVDVPLSDILDGDRLRLHPEVQAKGYFNIRLRGSSLELQAGGYVGLIALNDRVVIDVRPRVPVSNLARMLHLSGHVPIALRSLPRMYEAERASIEPLLDIYSDALARGVDVVQQRGLYRAYEQLRSFTSFPHGRVLIHDNVARLLPRGISHEVSTSWFQRSADNPINQCLKYAIWYLAARYARIRPKTTRARDIQRHLNRAFRVFDGVSLDLRRSFLLDPVVRGVSTLPALRFYYRDPLSLAVAIVREQAIVFDREGHNLRLSSLILNMNDVFEGYLRSVLRTYSQDEHWLGRVLDGNSAGGKLLFDKRPSVPANPDIVIALSGRRAQRVPLLLDAKYKPAPETPGREDLNQVIVYGASYRTPKVVLVYPRGRSSGKPGLRQLGSIGAITVYQYSFDLGARELREEEEAFAHSVRDAAFAAPAEPEGSQLSLFPLEGITAQPMA